MIELDLKNYIAADPTIVLLVVDRVFFVTHKNTTPCITIQTISSVRTPGLNYKFNNVRQVIQCSSWSTKYSETKEMAEALRVLLDDFTGTLGSYAIAECNLINSRDLPPVSPVEGTMSPIYHNVLEFEFLYTE